MTAARADNRHGRPWLPALPQSIAGLEALSLTRALTDGESLRLERYLRAAHARDLRRA